MVDILFEIRTLPILGNIKDLVFFNINIVFTLTVFITNFKHDNYKTVLHMIIAYKMLIILSYVDIYVQYLNHIL